MAENSPTPNQHQRSAYVEHKHSPSHIVSGSMRTRVVGVGLVVGLALTSGAVWASPTLRKGVDTALDKAPLPKVVQRALDPGDHPGSVTATEGEQKDKDSKKVEQAASQRRQLELEQRRQSGAAGSRTQQVGWSGGTGNRSTSEYAKPGSSSGDDQGSGNGTSTKKKLKYCWDFTYQQDAQAVYAADPSDPNGLDGNPGPGDDDGIACRDLPDDPNRPASTPVGAYELPTPSAPARAQILNPAKTYFGVFTEEAPFHYKELDQLSTAVAHRPSSVTWFAGWDQNFRADVVRSAWRRDMLPIITWEPRPISTHMGPGTDNAVNPDYQLSDIVQGDYDAYIRQWARDLREVNLPVGVRFAHEMNGFWYPWSEQANGNSPGEFIAAWRHVHELFQQEGALNAIWIWTPNVTGFPQSQPLNQLYPGSDYVDWVGLSGYYRKVIPGKAASFDNTYGKTLADLRAVAPGKKIFLSEVGATETGGQKPAWVTSFFDSLPQNPDVIGFTWFNRQVTAIPEGEKVPVTNDWRITSSPEVTAIFKQQLASGEFSGGTAGPGSRWEEAATTPAPTPSTPAPTPGTTGPASPSPSTTEPASTTPSPTPSLSDSPSPSTPATPTTPPSPSPSSPSSPPASPPPAPATPSTPARTSSSPSTPASAGSPTENAQG